MKVEGVSLLERNLRVLFLVNAGLSLGMELIGAIFPLFVQSLGATVFEVSLILSASGFVSTLLMAPSGFLSDRYGRKKLIVVSTVLAFFPPVLYTFVREWGHLLPLVMVYAAALAAFMPARMVSIADYTHAQNRVRIYGFMNIAWPLGSIVGPALGGFLADNYGWNQAFYLAASVFFLCLITAFFFKEGVNQESVKSKNALAQGLSLSREALYAVTILFLFHVLISFGVGAVHSLMSIYLTAKFELSKTEVGLFFSIVGGATLLSQIPGGMLAARYGMRRVMTWCLAFMSPLFLASSLMNSFHTFLATYTLTYWFYSMTWPISIAFLMDIVPGNQRGLATGIRQTGVRLGFTLGPLVGGILWETLGPVTPFYASILSTTLAIPLLLTLKEMKETP